MFGFYLKKFITFFIEPFGLIITLFFFGLYFLYTQKDVLSKFFLGLSLFFLLLFSYPPFANLLILPLENSYKRYDYNQTLKYIHVLGSGFNTDISQPVSSNLMEASIRRVIEGIVIYKQTPNSKIIFTDYSGRKTIYSVLNSKLALALGVKDEDIIIHTRSKDTKEEAEFTKSILPKNEKFALVTSASHIQRAMFLFRSLSLKPIAVPTDFKKYKINSYLMLPTLEALKISQMAIHEYIGIVWVYIKVKLFG